MTLLYISITIFITLLVISLYLVINERKMNIKNRLEVYTTDNFTFEYKENTSKTEKKTENVTFLGVFGKLLPLENYFEKKKILLNRARLLMKPEELLGICLISSMLFSSIIFLFTNNIFLMIICFIIGFKIPVIYVQKLKKDRAKKLNNQLPDAITILANGIRAGLSFNQAIVIAAKEMDDPIAEDLKKVVHENLLGKNIDEALKDFATRTDDDDVEILVTAVLIQRQVGGNISEIFDTISNTIRERVKLKGDIRSMTAQSKLSAIIIGIIPPSIVLILYLINKDFLMPLITTLPGNLMLIVALFMQGLGIFILVKMLDLKV